MPKVRVNARVKKVDLVEYVRFRASDARHPEEFSNWLRVQEQLEHEQRVWPHMVLGIIGVSCVFLGALWAAYAQTEKTAHILAICALIPSGTLLILTGYRGHLARPSTSWQRYQTAYPEIDDRSNKARFKMKTGS